MVYDAASIDIFKSSSGGSLAGGLSHRIIVTAIKPAKISDDKSVRIK
jgi:hypothetical protein